MCFASMGTVVASLIIVGIFVLVGANIDKFSSEIQRNLQIETFLETDTTDEKIREYESIIKGFQLGEVTIVTKEQAVERFKKTEIFKGHEGILEGYVLPPSILLKLKSAQDADIAIQKIKAITGVDPEKVRYNKEVIDKVVRFMQVIRIVSIVVMFLLAATSVMIISNTIKLAVFARRKEIGIMKYIGATDWFIRWPFIIESIIIGTISSLIALFIVSKGYDSVIGYLGKVNSAASSELLNFAAFNSISDSLLLIYLAIGIGMGCIGSAISIRKYLRV